MELQVETASEKLEGVVCARGRAKGHRLYTHTSLFLCVSVRDCCGSVSQAGKSGADPTGETISACEL